VGVHFAPFQGQQTVRKSAQPLEGVVMSPTGFLSDSGGIFYVIRLAYDKAVLAFGTWSVSQTPLAVW
jgi:hypothetical protein